MVSYVTTNIKRIAFGLCCLYFEINQMISHIYRDQSVLEQNITIPYKNAITKPLTRYFPSRNFSYRYPNYTFLLLF